MEFLQNSFIYKKILAKNKKTFKNIKVNINSIIYNMENSEYLKDEICSCFSKIETILNDANDAYERIEDPYVYEYTPSEAIATIQILKERVSNISLYNKLQELDDICEKYITTDYNFGESPNDFTDYYQGISNDMKRINQILNS